MAITTGITMGITMGIITGIMEDTTEVGIMEAIIEIKPLILYLYFLKTHET